MGKKSRRRQATTSKTMAADANAHAPPAVMGEEIEKMLICPISLEIMKDPVTLIQSNQTYDRESLCACLLQDAYRCPVTNQVFQNKLQFEDNITSRQLLMLRYGYDAYQPYDDSEFKHQYNTDWDRVQAIFEKGWHYDHGCPEADIEQDYVKAREYYEAAAKYGHVRATYYLGLLYYCARGTKLDFTKARHYFQIAADRGLPIAQGNLGFLLSNGEGGPKDVEKARHYYELAADQGLGSAQHNLGTMYRDGEGGVEKDIHKAIKLFKLAAKDDNPQSYVNLGTIYLGGCGVPRDIEKAIHYYEVAAEKGVIAAQIGLMRINAATRKVYYYILAFVVILIALFVKWYFF